MIGHSLSRLGAIDVPDTTGSQRCGARKWIYREMRRSVCTRRLALDTPFG